MKPINIEKLARKFVWCYGRVPFDSLHKKVQKDILIACKHYAWIKSVFEEHKRGKK